MTVSIAQKARHRATKKLVNAHKEEYDKLYGTAMVEVQAEVEKANPKPVVPVQPTPKIQ